MSTQSQLERIELIGKQVRLALRESEKAIERSKGISLPRARIAKYGSWAGGAVIGGLAVIGAVAAPFLAAAGAATAALAVIGGNRIEQNARNRVDVLMGHRETLVSGRSLMRDVQAAYGTIREEVERSRAGDDSMTADFFKLQSQQASLALATRTNVTTDYRSGPKAGAGPRLG